MRLHVACDEGSVEIEGRAALRAAAAVVGRTHRLTVDRETIGRATEWIEECGGPEASLDETMKFATMYTKPFGLFSLPAEYSLGLLMALNDEAEHRAMEGGDAELAESWHEAEEIARADRSRERLLSPNVLARANARVASAMERDTP
jgi:hypothetical protein